jgi:hypothetical protein
MAEEKRTCVRLLNQKPVKNDPMATKHTTTTASLHELARAEIARQVQGLTARRDEITKERGRLYAAMRKGGTVSAPLDHNELAARNVAKKLLNGSAPEGLVPPDNSSNITLDQQLSNEARGIDIALRVLNDKNLEAKAVAAVQWAEENRAKWRELCRDVVLAAIRLDALGETVREFLESCPDLYAVNMPMGALVERRHLSEMLINEMVSEGLSAGVVTQADIKKAKTTR